jgi:hypothetical protein
MRRAVGLAVVVAVAAAAGPGLGFGCSHDSKPVVQPDEHPPLPPASGTPIGYLVDDATELKLRDDQLTQLKVIDEDLAAKLEVLDGKLRGDAAAPAASAGQGGRGRGFRTGGRQGGRGGRMAGAGGGSGGAGVGSGGAGAGARRQRRGGGNANATGTITEERAADVRAAIEKSLGLLDVVQRVIAKRVLADHGVDVDAGRPQATPTESEELGEQDEPDPGRGAGSGSDQ